MHSLWFLDTNKNYKLEREDIKKVVVLASTTKSENASCLHQAAVVQLPLFVGGKNCSESPDKNGEGKNLDEAFTHLEILSKGIKMKFNAFKTDIRSQQLHRPSHFSFSSEFHISPLGIVFLSEMLSRHPSSRESKAFNLL